tara:strand:- start:596 stop:2248 length:1653 start_codon:yes stop_codon:yes gene_type:complete
MKIQKYFALLLFTIFSSCYQDQQNTITSTNEIVGLDKLKKYISNFNEKDYEIYKQFYKNSEAYDFLSNNIPLIDLPNKDIEETYYFRWWTYRKHIKNTDDGFVITEFLPQVFWSMKHNTINCPAAHHIYEGRWLKDPKYISEYINFWLKNSEDGIRQYSFWIADATLAFNNIHRNDSILSSQLSPLISNYNEWEKIRKDKDKSLFWQFDVNDGMELTVSGRILNENIEKFGVEATRPTINSYMYGDASAISKIAFLNNNFEIGKNFQNKANKIKEELQDRLWNDELNFFTVLPKNHNKATKPLNVRELIGYVPWYFNLPDDKPEYALAWEKLKDTTGFYAPYGLTVTEQSHPFFKISYQGHECQWNGPSWPFATTQTLKALANYVNNYSENKSISKDDYYPLLLQYAKSHKILNENGEVQNWIDENLNPYTGDWISRTRLKNWEGKGWSDGKGGVERGKDYNHSGFCDLVLSDLLGIKLSIDGTIEINPLIPKEWEWFSVDNIFHQGRKVSLVWDKTGEKYNLGKGLMLFLENKIVVKTNKIEKLVLNNY